MNRGHLRKLDFTEEYKNNQMEMYNMFLLTNTFFLWPSSPIDCLVWSAVGIFQVKNGLDFESVL